jgi:hypothetical protein
VGRTPALVTILWICSLAVTIPPALFLNRAIESHLDASLEADAAADGVNFDWMQEFRAQSGQLGRTLRPDVIGFGAVMDNTSAVADVSFRPLVAIVCGFVFLSLVWFLSPALIWRLATDRPERAGSMLAVCGSFLPRMFRLAFVAFVLYGALFASVHPWLLGDIFDRVTRETTVERTGFFIRIGFYAIFFLLVAAANLLLDYTRIRLVVENRRSIIGAVSAAARFMRKNAGRVVGTYVLNVVCFAVILGAYALAAPGAGSGGWWAWGPFVIGQVYIAARLFLKLAFWASEVAVLQARFGCPGFVRLEADLSPAKTGPYMSSNV